MRNVVKDGLGVYVLNGMGTRVGDSEGWGSSIFGMVMRSDSLLSSDELLSDAH